MRRILSILLENEPGSLSRIVGLFSQRAYNIDSLTVGTTDDHSLSRITITTHIERELLLVKVFAQDEAKRAAVTRVVDVFQGAILDMGRNSYTLQLVSSTDKIESFLDTLRHETDLIEVVRSGAVGIGRGDKALKA